MTYHQGELHEIFIGDSWVKAEVAEVRQCDRGQLVKFNSPGYGVTGDYWFPDGVVDSDHRKIRSMIPPEYYSKTGKDFKWSEYGENVDVQKRIANSFVVQFREYMKQGRGLYIYSKAKGSGKTMLACCLSNEVLAKCDISTKFITAPEYVELCTRKDDESNNTREAIRNCMLLILDDIGAEHDKDWISAALFRLVDYRDKNKLCTIYTSNCDIDQLHGDDRTQSRIEGHSIPLRLPDKSIRKERAQRYTRDFLRGLGVE